MDMARVVGKWSGATVVGMVGNMAFDTNGAGRGNRGTGAATAGAEEFMATDVKTGGSTGTLVVDVGGT